MIAVTAAIDSAAGPALAIVGWLTVAGVVLNLVSQAAGWSRPALVVAVQSLTRPLVPAAAGLSALAAVHRQWTLTAACALAAAATLCFGLAVGRRPPAPAAPTSLGEPLTIVHGNLWFANDEMRHDPQRVADALMSLEPDVIALSEYTREHAAVFATTTMASRYPHRVERAAQRAAGSAIWSRRPVRPAEGPDTMPITAAAEIDGITVFAVHTPSPIANLDAWLGALELWGRSAPPAGRPTVAIGDYNADLWHPALRRALRNGWRDAHQSLGALVSASWPRHRRPLPAFVRLDRALVNSGLTVISVDAHELPGSDHRAVAVTVAVATRVAP